MSALGTKITDPSSLVPDPKGRCLQRSDGRSTHYDFKYYQRRQAFYWGSLFSFSSQGLWVHAGCLCVTHTHTQTQPHSYVPVVCIHTYDGIEYCLYTSTHMYCEGEKIPVSYVSSIVHSNNRVCSLIWVTVCNGYFYIVCWFYTPNPQAKANSRGCVCGGFLKFIADIYTCHLPYKIPLIIWSYYVNFRLNIFY